MSWLEILQEEWAIRALIASSMVGLMCGALGCFIVLRNMSLIGDALAHAILPGVVFAFVFFGYSTIGFFFGAVAAGLLTAIGITWIQHQVGTKNDAAIGIVFTAMFSIGVMGISYISRNEGVHLDLKDFLFGNVLGVSDQDLILTAVVCIYVFLSIIAFYRYLFVSTFQAVIAQTMGISVKMIHYFLMLLLSFAVVASLQTVGVILVVAMLITPASTALLLTDRLDWAVFYAALIGLFSALFGLVFAIELETTPGPAMAVVATLIYLAAVFFAPKKGLLFKQIRLNKVKRRILLEDILKQAYRLQEKGMLNVDRLLQQIPLRDWQLNRHLRILRRHGWVEPTRLYLTASGIEASQRLVRAHRLWETYLAGKVGLNAEQIHDEAERLEHHLTDDILDEVDKVLGYPTKDPHGSPIPVKTGYPRESLSRLETHQKASIAQQQMNESISAKLWELGLLPGTHIYIMSKDTHTIHAKVAQDEEIDIPIELAKLVSVNAK
ncbi:MAG TPA: iron chelate uptake ABC transporter family permease subunit [Saprospiraceae bacterium]|nr:iron chelate uptake ABC transporter family permease subunit [Saprospiraceae bacterium]HMQ84710.1 iron chelate uptake ABC transporter family permease subunit [Saprospiraceae bacterium]